MLSRTLRHRNTIKTRAQNVFCVGTQKKYRKCYKKRFHFLSSRPHKNTKLRETSSRTSPSRIIYKTSATLLAHLSRSFLRSTLKHQFFRESSSNDIAWRKKRRAFSAGSRVYVHAYIVNGCFLIETQANSTNSALLNNDQLREALLRHGSSFSWNLTSITV